MRRVSLQTKLNPQRSELRLSAGRSFTTDDTIHQETGPLYGSLIQEFQGI